MNGLSTRNLNVGLRKSKWLSKSLWYLFYDWNLCWRIRCDCFRHSCKKPKACLKIPCSGPIQNYVHTSENENEKQMNDPNKENSKVQTGIDSLLIKDITVNTKFIGLLSPWCQTIHIIHVSISQSYLLLYLVTVILQRGFQLEKLNVRIMLRMELLPISKVSLLKAHN